ncbi:cytochrome c biogenesis protein ResC [Geomonas silvestris]|uniref:Cytochrome c biogenesis protein ResC n=1 Tax=Geomonas silvestris TaxID=2740184 RepID=A0A6V8MKR1_9BACT|nr:cytochrome c biogenesis protein CcsA [Geomonas silvestris]GFO60524.1 cytochrome c biogenesis protein ResC [Geomonas silvestris]
MIINPIALYTGGTWCAVLFYIVATLCNVYGVLFRNGTVERRSFIPLWIGLLVHSSVMAYWWSVVGHGPYMAPSEVLTSDAWMAVCLYLVCLKPYPKVRPASVVVFPMTFLLLALAMFYNPGIRTLPATFSSIWLIIHIGLYKIALATLLIALAFSLFYLLRQRPSPAPWLMRLPEIGQLDVYAYRFAGFGFVFWTIGMLAGSIWAYQSWGRFWGWDPVETWSLVTWMLFGIYLHCRRFFRISGKAAAGFFILCFVVSLVSLFVTSHMNTSIHAEYFR